MCMNMFKMSRAVVSLFVYFTINFFACDEAAKILAVFPIPSISHQVVLRPLTQELAKRGHEVTVITTDPAFPTGEVPANLTEIDLHDLSYRIWEQHFFKATIGKRNDLYTQIETAFDILVDVFEEQMKTEAVKKIIYDKTRHFDLLMTEASMSVALALTHVYKVPLIQISSFGGWNSNYETVGAPILPLLYPHIVNQLVHNFSTWEKVSKLYKEIWFQGLYHVHDEKRNAMVKRVFGPRTPTMNELSKNIDMLFLNEHPIWEGNRPVPPNLIYIGSIYEKPEEELPEDLKSYLDSSVNGVIYINFGTNVETALLPLEKIKIFVKVLSQLPYNVLWKWDVDKLPMKIKTKLDSQKIKISNIFQQSDLLRHPNIKLFITQASLQSTEEAICAGVPVIGIPLLFDQWYNAEKYVYHKIGLKLVIEKLTTKQFRNAINIVIGDKSYRQNVVRLRTLMHDQPQRPLERAVWWTEHVLRHGGAQHLRRSAAKIGWNDNLENDAVTNFLIIFLIAVTLFVLLISIIVQRLIKKFHYRSAFKSKTD